MSIDIKLQKGLDIPLKGDAETKIMSTQLKKDYAIYPEDFHGIVPKMLLKEGEAVLLGQPIFYSKINPEIKFVSPTSGNISTIQRGAKRRILAIKISSNSDDEKIRHKVVDPNNLNAEDIKKNEEVITAYLGRSGAV